LGGFAPAAILHTGDDQEEIIFLIAFLYLVQKAGCDATQSRHPGFFAQSSGTITIGYSRIKA
jgi:hypothetical protein